jgi:NAD(P)-dependent dehydrogenase (short-subunit alcohol dehydrogenase family)
LLDKKIIVVTGGGGLIGSQFAHTVAKNGGVAIVADIDIKSAVRVAKEINNADYSGSAAPSSLDITNKNSLCELIEELRKQYGRIDAVVNNAYPRNNNYGCKFEEVTYQDFCENVSIHLGGYFLVAQQFGVFFRHQGDGNIINMASVYGVVAPNFQIYTGTEMTMPVEYAAIKSSIIHLTKYMAKFFKGSNVRVNSISPGGILDFQPNSFLENYADYCLNKGMLDKEDLNGTLVYLLSDMASCLNGQNIVVDDGFSL